MVTVEIVINSTRVMGVRVTISCRYCIALEVMLLFLVAFKCGNSVIEPLPPHISQSVNDEFITPEGRK